MSMDDNWSNLQPGILILIFQNFEFLDDCWRFVSVCKSWRESAVRGLEMPCLPPARYPFLLLAEDVAPGVLTSDCEFDSDEEGYYSFEDDEVIGNVEGVAEEDSNEDSDDSTEEEYSGGVGVVAGGAEEDISDGGGDDEDDKEDSKESEKDNGGVGVVAGGVEEDIGDDDSVEEDGDEEEDNNDSEQQGEVSGSGAGEVIGDDDSVEEDGDEEEDNNDSEQQGEDSGSGAGEVIGDDDSVEEDGDEEEDNNDSEQQGEDNGDKYNYLNYTIGSSRGLYSLLTGKTYRLDLPEAAGRLILGANKGWLVTLGRDLQVNLLHPLLRHQISLPPMLSFSRQFNYSEAYPPEEVSDFFIWKVAVSSKILNKNTAFSLYRHHASPSPIVMAIYGQRQYLGFARLGDKVWTDVKFAYNDQANFDDIAYHKGNFYAVSCHGGIFVCGNNDNEEGGDIRGRQIESFETKDWLQKYLVESSSGSGLLLVVRYRKAKYFHHKWAKYRTTSFSVWRLDIKYSDSLEDISCSLKEEKDLGNEAIFIGTASPIAVASSENIKPNSIYFTDDNWLTYHRLGGGHDMGIFNIEHRTIEPHFQGKSIHPVSPPLWYF